MPRRQGGQADTGQVRPIIAAPGLPEKGLKTCTNDVKKGDLTSFSLKNVVKTETERIYVQVWHLEKDSLRRQRMSIGSAAALSQTHISRKGL